MTRRKECTITVSWDEPGNLVDVSRQALESRLKASFAPTRKATVIVGHISDITPPSPADEVRRLLFNKSGNWLDRAERVVQIVEELETRCSQK